VRRDPRDPDGAVSGRADPDLHHHERPGADRQPRGADPPQPRHALRDLPHAAVLPHPADRPRGGRTDRRLHPTRRAVPDRPPPLRSGAGDARRDHLPLQLERLSLAAGRDPVGTSHDVAARALDVPGSARHELDAADGGQRHGHTADADCVHRRATAVRQLDRSCRCEGLMAEVAFRGVTKVFDGKVVAVDALDHTIENGEFMVLVGPSGCGKTTALRMVAGLETPTAGKIEIGGRVVNDLSPKARDIAMVFQNYALYPHMTVEENIAFGLRRHGFPRREIAGRVREVSAMLDLHDLLRRKPSQLSGGQRQRVAMGRAIARHPHAFLLAEPLSNLDAQLRADLKRLHQEVRTTSIYVTHDQVEATTLGERIAVMNSGRLQQVRTPREVYARPENLFVAGFIGSPPMNLAAARVVNGDLQL